MIACKNVAKLLTSDELATRGWWKRAEVRLHLLMCKYCSRLARQLRQMRAAARRMPDSVSSDPGLEDRIISRLSGRK
jgi:hypothetical protein